MTVSLKKGENVSLTKESPNLTAVTVGLGWTARTTTGATFDLDASALACGNNGKVLDDQWFVFYRNLKSPDGSIQHMGDDLVGGDGVNDSEQIKIDLAAVSSDVESIPITVSIYDADSKKETFGDVKKAYIRIEDQATAKELARFDLPEDYSSETALVVGELYRKDSEWKFKANGQGYASGLSGIATDYGVHVGA